MGFINGKLCLFSDENIIFQPGAGLNGHSNQQQIVVRFLPVALNNSMTEYLATETPTPLVPVLSPPRPLVQSPAAPATSERTDNRRPDILPLVSTACDVLSSD
jgi:hypothetical protein